MPILIGQNFFFFKKKICKKVKFMYLLHDMNTRTIYSSSNMIFEEL